MSASKKELGFNATATIMRFRQIAAEAGDALLTEGDVQPDHELLDMCADALHHLTHARRAMDARDFCNWRCATKILWGTRQPAKLTRH
jgi:hypothetical protein